MFVFCKDDYPFDYVTKVKCEVRNRVIQFFFAGKKHSKKQTFNTFMVMVLTTIWFNIRKKKMVCNTTKHFPQSSN